MINFQSKLVCLLFGLIQYVNFYINAQTNVELPISWKKEPNLRMWRQGINPAGQLDGEFPKMANITFSDSFEPNPVSAISLAIVFDSTGSMGNDLKQVKIGSRNILQRHMQRGEANYIKDFVLVKVHDPGN